MEIVPGEGNTTCCALKRAYSCARASSTNKDKLACLEGNRSSTIHRSGCPPLRLRPHAQINVDTLTKQLCTVTATRNVSDWGNTVARDDWPFAVPQGFTNVSRSTKIRDLLANSCAVPHYTHRPHLTLGDQKGRAAYKMSKSGHPSTAPAPPPVTRHTRSRKQR